jgi:hypothetical protein
MRAQADVPPPPPEEQQQLVQFIQKQAKLLEQARAIEAQQRATAAKVSLPTCCGTCGTDDDLGF